MASLNEQKPQSLRQLAAEGRRGLHLTGGDQWPSVLCMQAQQPTGISDAVGAVS